MKMSVLPKPLWIVFSFLGALFVYAVLVEIPNEGMRKIQAEQKPRTSQSIRVKSLTIVNREGREVMSIDGDQGIQFLDDDYKETMLMTLEALRQDIPRKDDQN